MVNIRKIQGDISLAISMINGALQQNISSSILKNVKCALLSVLKVLRQKPLSIPSLAEQTDPFLKGVKLCVALHI